MSSNTGTWIWNRFPIMSVVAPAARRVGRAVRSAHPLARDQIDDGQQHHRTEERHKQPGDADVARIDRACTHHRADQPAAEKGTDDADHDIEEYSLTSIGAH